MWIMCTYFETVGIEFGRTTKLVTHGPNSKGFGFGSVTWPSRLEVFRPGSISRLLESLRPLVCHA